MALVYVHIRGFAQDAETYKMLNKKNGNQLTRLDSEHAQSRWTQSDGVVVTDELVGVFVVQRQTIVVVGVVQVRHHHIFQPVKYVCFKPFLK